MKWDTDRTNELILRSQAGDTDARRQLAEENAPLVRSLVRRFIGRGTDYEELCQVGNIGLLKAVAGFNPKFNVRFSTYAVPMISGEIKRFVRDNNTVKMPRSLKDMQQKIRYARQKLSVDLSREPGAEEIANEIGCDLEDVLFALESLNPCVSLDEPLSGENDLTVMDTVEDRHRRISETDKLALRQCIEQLDEKEKKVIILRYFKDCTQMRVADMMGLSQVQISRIESRTIEKLRRKLG